MQFLGGGPSWLQRAVQAKADEQKAIMMSMMAFSDYCKYKPTYDQFEPFCVEACRQGYSLRGLYEIFASGRIPADLDALIRKHALE